MASIALIIMPAAAPAVARDYGSHASLTGHQTGIAGASLLFTVVAMPVVTCVEALGMNLIGGRIAIYSFLAWEKETHEI